MPVTADGAIKLWDKFKDDIAAGALSSKGAFFVYGIIFSLLAIFLISINNVVFISSDGIRVKDDEVNDLKEKNNEQKSIIESLNKEISLREREISLMNKNNSILKRIINGQSNHIKNTLLQLQSSENGDEQLYISITSSYQENIIGIHSMDEILIEIE